MKEAIGKDMTAFAVRCELDFVDRDKVRIQLPWHGFHRADIEARAGRLDLLLASDERDLAGTYLGHDLVVDLAGQKPKRQSDDADLVCEHALNGKMGFARVGWSKDRCHAAPAMGRAVGACGLRG